MVKRSMEASTDESRAALHTDARRSQRGSRSRSSPIVEVYHLVKCMTNVMTHKGKYCGREPIRACVEVKVGFALR